MVYEIIITIIKYLVPLVIGYLISLVANYKKKYKESDEALKCLLRSAITSKYYVYTELGSIPEYEKQNLIYLSECYFKMGGNSYIKQIMEELNRLPIKK